MTINLGAAVPATQEPQEARVTARGRAPPIPAIEMRLGSPPGRSLLPEELGFLVRYGVSPDTLADAVRRAERIGVAPLTALLRSGAMDEAVYARLLAHHLGAQAAGEIEPDPRVTLKEALRQGWLRGYRPDGRQALVVDVGGTAARAMMAPAMRHHARHLMYAGSRDFHALVRRHFARQLALDASRSVPDAESARTGLTPGQVRCLAGALLVVAGLALAFPAAMLVLLPMALGLFFLAAALMQLAAAAAGYAAETPAEERDDAQLPAYSVLVPLYREAAVVPDLVAALAGLDYPPEKLQILLVIEEHDADTLAAIRALALPPHIAPFIAPAGAPQTKPRAINAAIPFVTGTFLVVYDAEDRPEPGQLRAAVARFADVPDTVACLQARLVIDNSADSWLTRFFTIEYAALFDVVKAGTARLGLPVPLGGTSNHFRADALRAIGLWDAWNVTEDADLGFRLAIHGFGVEDLNAATYEEAPNRLGPWLHQRSRWLKGWMQTIISHSRRPVAVWRAMGTVNFLSAVAQSAGVIVGALGAPVFHTLVVLRVMAPEPFGSGGLVLQMADALIVVLGIAGILSVYVPAFMALHRRRLWPLAGWALALPLYQLLVSVAAYKAAWELVRAPHRWNKTTHGTARRRQTPMA